MMQEEDQNIQTETAGRPFLYIVSHFPFLDSFPRGFRLLDLRGIREPRLFTSVY
jgi:hypothetical protein